MAYVKGLEIGEVFSLKFDKEMNTPRYLGRDPWVGR